MTAGSNLAKIHFLSCKKDAKSTDKDRMLNNYGKFNQIVATSVCHMCKYESAYIAWNVFTIEVIIPAKQNPA